jgi:hypothetical protein
MITATTHILTSQANPGEAPRAVDTAQMCGLNLSRAESQNRMICFSHSVELRLIKGAPIRRSAVA